MDRRIVATFIAFLILAATAGCATKTGTDPHALPVAGRATFHLDGDHPPIDWIEARMNEAGGDLSDQTLTDTLNADLFKAGVCSEVSRDGKTGRCVANSNFDENRTTEEELSNVELTRLPNAPVILVKINYDSRCGVYPMNYLEHWVQTPKPHWQHFWQTAPRDEGWWDSKVTVSDGLGGGAPGLIVEAGDYLHCNSVWETGRYAVWMADGALATVAPVVNETRETTIDGPLPMIARMQGNDLTMLLEGGEAKRDEVVARYRLEGSRLVRPNPIATTATGFVVEWLRSSWADISIWSPATDPALRAIHEQLREQALGIASFVYDAEVPFSGTHCRTWKDVWQVKIDEPGDDPKSMYFLVRKTGLDSFRLEKVSASPWPKCANNGGKPDEQLYGTP